MILYLIRHGETDYNRQGIVQGGGVDSDLNKLGRRQAQAFFDHYKHLRFDAVYASKLKRTHQTLEPWVREQGYQLEMHEALNEFSWGWMEGKKPDEQMRSEFYRLKQAWAAGQLDQGIEGGETPLGAWNRAKPFFDELYQRHQDQKILVCSHGRTSRIVLAQLLGYGLERMGEFNHTNTGLNVLHFQPTGKVFAEKINDVTHLEETLQL